MPSPPMDAAIAALNQAIASLSATHAILIERYGKRHLGARHIRKELERVRKAQAILCGRSEPPRQRKPEV